MLANGDTKQGDEETPALVKAQELLSSSTQKIADLEKQLAEANEKVAFSEKTLATTTGRIAAQTSDLGKANERLGIARNMLTDIERKAAGQGKELEEVRAALSEKDKLLAERDKQIADGAKSVAERDQKIADLEASIDVARDGSSDELKTLREKLAAMEQQEAALKTEIEALNTSKKTFEDEISTLKSKLAAGEGKAGSDTETEITLSGGSELPGSGSETAAPESPLVTAPLNPANTSPAQNLGDISRPVTFPLWSVLLGLLGLLLTGLLAWLFGRRGGKQELATVGAGAAAVADESGEDLVFHKARLDRKDPELDVEAHRVAPRRSEEGVAILDPSMTVDQTAQSQHLPPTRAGITASVDNQTHAAGSQPFEVDLKLAMAEAYLELEDSVAAREMLHEVQREGSPHQIGDAERILKIIGE